MNRIQRAWKALTVRSGGTEDYIPQVNLSASNNLFGSLGRLRFPFSTSADFIPLDSDGATMQLRGQNVEAQWLGLESKMMQYWAYRLCSPLAAVIDRLAEADTNGKIKFLDSDDIPIKNISKIPKLNRIYNLFQNPNPLQTWYEFNNEQVAIAKVFGYCPVFMVGGLEDKTYTKYMFNLNPYLVTPIRNEKFSLYGNTDADIVAGIDNTNQILEWRGNCLGKEFNIKAKDVLIINDGIVKQDTQGVWLPLSKVAGLDFFVSNICAAMEADNVLLKKKGPLGVFSHDAKPDIGGWTPMEPEMKDDLQDDLKRYGLTLGQLQYVISKTPIKWNAMSFNLRDLMTKETVRQGIDGICDRMGYPAELMSGKNATYENRNSAEKFLYQNNVIPFSLRRCSQYCDWFGITGLTLDYYHLPVLQEDIMHAGQARLANSQATQIDWEGGRLTWNECRKIDGMDEIAGMDIYYNEYLKKFPPPQVKNKPVNKAKVKTNVTS